MKPFSPPYIAGLKDASEVDITSLNADWTSKWYPFGGWLYLSIILAWVNNTITGTLYLDYSGFADPADGYSIKSTVAIAPGDIDHTFLDDNLATGWYRLRWDYTSGSPSGLLKTGHQRKKKAGF